MSLAAVPHSCCCPRWPHPPASALTPVGGTSWGQSRPLPQDGSRLGSSQPFSSSGAVSSAEVIQGLNHHRRVPSAHLSGTGEPTRRPLYGRKGLLFRRPSWCRRCHVALGPPTAEGASLEVGVPAGGGSASLTAGSRCLRFLRVNVCREGI